ncbi:hypothetical protein LAU42_07190 [Macrococcus armenti]|uniref:hypothetical protein n=1 Tax=Macrococcus armenti TaxID=2875764 RepID=UPI001CCC83DC|nr:hypothetical protein [Macrococcus armenti]UBH21580.1 hypothetical protein LAU42_07190 [Macrococcus armenti]
MTDLYNVMTVTPVYDFNDNLVYAVTSRKLAKQLVREHNQSVKHVKSKLYIAPDVNVVGGKMEDDNNE